jgi:hypothetical protein
MRTSQSGSDRYKVDIATTIGSFPKCPGLELKKLGCRANRSVPCPRKCSVVGRHTLEGVRYANQDS